MDLKQNLADLGCTYCSYISGICTPSISMLPLHIMHVVTKVKTYYNMPRKRMTSFITSSYDMVVYVVVNLDCFQISYSLSEIL